MHQSNNLDERMLDLQFECIYFFLMKTHSNELDRKWLKQSVKENEREEDNTVRK